jgi:hypothetical protein
MWIRRLSELLVAAAIVTLPAAARAEDPPPAEPSADPLDAYRERFRGGLEKYKVGAYAEAIVVWEAIYREIGPDQGYRLVFNLARAYDRFGDFTRAAEHYEAYAREVDRRRDAGAAIEENVAKQENEARLRLAELATTRGRIRVEAGDRPMVVRIDSGEPRLAGFVAYVAPGKHAVTFGAGKDAVRVEIAVKEGEVVVAAPPRFDAPTPPTETPPISFETRLERPFSGGIVLAGGIATIASLAVPIITYANASAIRDDYESAATRDEQLPLRSDYESSRSLTYATLAIPITLGVATAALTAWWLLGTKETKVPIAARGVGFRF